MHFAIILKTMLFDFNKSGEWFGRRKLWQSSVLPTFVTRVSIVLSLFHAVKLMTARSTLGLDFFEFNY